MRNDDPLSAGSSAAGDAPLVVVAAPLVAATAGVAAPTTPPSWIPIAVGPTKFSSRASPP